MNREQLSTDIETYHKMIYRLAYSCTGNRFDAEDITQDMFDYSLDKWVDCQWQLSSSFNSVYKQTFLYKLFYIDETILEGNEYSIAFSRAEFFSGIDLPGIRSLQGHVEMKFEINKLALMNSITVTPDVELDFTYSVLDVNNISAIILYGEKIPLR